MKVNSAQRVFLADKLMDTANLVLGGLVIGQLVSKNIQSNLVIIGLVFYVVTIVVTTNLRKNK